MGDTETHQVLAEITVGVEPEGMGISPDGSTVVNTSETTNMAHFIDTETYEITQNTLVDQRPRFAQFTDDGSLLYVSAEIDGTVTVIDPATGEILHKIGFEVPGVLPEMLQPVGVRVTDDGSRVFVALGPPTASPWSRTKRGRCSTTCSWAGASGNSPSRRTSGT